MTSNNETVSRQNLWAGNITKSQNHKMHFQLQNFKISSYTTNLLKTASFGKQLILFHPRPVINSPGLKNSDRGGPWRARPVDRYKKSEFSTIPIWICWIECSNFQITSSMLKHLLLSLIWKWVSSTYEKISWAYCWGRSRLWEGKKVLMENSEGRGVAHRLLTVMCCFLAYIFPQNCFFHSPFQNGPLFEGAKYN